MSRRCVGDRHLALGGSHEPWTQPSASARFANSHSATLREPDGIAALAETSIQPWH
jgi:hypothetical protein